MTDLENLIRCLADKPVEFVIVGGVAATVHGSSYVTYDLDVCYARHDAGLKRLAEALRPYNPRLRDVPEDVPFIWDARTLKQGLNFTLQTDLGGVALLGEIVGVGNFHKVIASSVTVELFGVECAVLSLGGLIATKRAAGRPKDRLVLPELEALLEVQERDSDSDP